MSTLLTELNEKRYGKIISIEGSQRFLDRAGAMGLTPNTEIQMVQNKKRQPILVYARDTLIALNRKESKGIMVKGVE
ncbi:MAG: ferrous iron transport protein A [Clostridia bacterium]|nr:ferrous iron transport protein A [Clostridia bacterium]